MEQLMQYDQDLPQRTGQEEHLDQMMRQGDAELFRLINQNSNYGKAVRRLRSDPYLRHSPEELMEKIVVRKEVGTTTIE